MILYWLTVAALYLAAACCGAGYARAWQAGSIWWQRFHARLGFGAAIAAGLFAMIAAPIAYKL